MEGIDKDWVYCNYERDAPYTHLPPGHYVFKVKAQSPDGVWNNTPTLLAIIISPPFWQTWWFYLADALAAITLVFFTVRVYTERKLGLQRIELAHQKIEIEKLHAVSKERMRIASDMHDDIGAGLTSIRLLSEVANMKAGKDSPIKSEIEKIVKSAGSFSDNLREIIWTMNTRYDKLEDFIIYVRSYAVEFFDDSPIKFLFNSPVSIPEITMPGELRRNLFLCIKEALHNIVKHAYATEASLTFNVVENPDRTGQVMLYTEIRDNGKGINTNQINKFGNGLNTMKERLNRLGSYLEIEVNNGTKLVFKINI